MDPVDLIVQSYHAPTGDCRPRQGLPQPLPAGELIRRVEPARCASAPGQALELACTDPAAVRHLLESAELGHAAPALAEMGALARYERPLPELSGYDALLANRKAQ